MRSAWLTLGLGTLLVAELAVAQVTFEEVGASRGLQPAVLADGMGVGVTAVDFDDDGDIDLFVPLAAGHPDQLYINAGDGQFVENAGQYQLASTDEHRAALWFDFDGDQRLDLFLTNDVPLAGTAYELFRQDSASCFWDVTQQAGLYLPQANPSSIHRGGQCAADLNRDGYLDLIAAIWNGPVQVFINNRDGTFTDASIASGVGIDWQWSHQPVVVDVNGDRWPDIYIAIDFYPNQLWINQQDGTFQNVAVASGSDNAMNDMGVALGDYDNDGDPDIYVTNIYNFDQQSQQQEHNILLRNDTVGQSLQFVEVAGPLGVEDTSWGWGATFLDCDNDGWLDLAVTNGWRSGPFTTDPSKLYLNPGVSPFAFNDVSDTTGFNDTLYGSSLVAFDFDRDGDLDLAQTTIAVDGTPSSIRLLENTPVDPPNAGRYLVVQPRMDGPNHWAIGAVCRCTVNGQTQMRFITAGTSYLGQEPAEAFFGLSSASQVDELAIDWPDGTETVLVNVAADQVLIVSHGGFGDLNANGAIQLDDWALFMPCFSGPESQSSNACLPADFNADRAVDLADVAIFQQRFDAP